MKRIARWIVLAAGGVMATAGSAAEHVLVEAESFADHGGWMLDTQFMATMGSPYLLAHGMGRPVADAVTTVTLPRTGTYRVFVRTKDWVAPWQAAGQPGRFQVLVNGTPLSETLGTSGAAWFWQSAGTVEMDQAEVPTRAPRSDRFRRTLRCDSVDAGPRVYSAQRRGGAAAVASRVARAGRRADGERRLRPGGGGRRLCRHGIRPVGRAPGLPGGSPAGSARVGRQRFERSARLGQRAHSTRRVPAHRGDRRGVRRQRDEITGPSRGVWGRLEREGRARGAEHRLVSELPCRPGARWTATRIVAVQAVDTRTGEQFRFAGKLFADCTGHGTVGYLAGADLGDDTRRSGWA